MLNQYIVVGRINDIKRSDTDTRMFILECQRNFKNADGLYDYDYIGIYLDDAMYDSVEKYVELGSTIAVKGRVEQPRPYDSVGVPPRIIAEKISFM